MNTIKQFFSAALIAGLFFTGCDKSTDPVTESEAMYEDAAESIAASVGDESGGATESFADVMIAGGGGAMGSAAPVMDGEDQVTAGVPTYDSTTGWWSVSVSRTMENMRVTRSITREYRYQYQKNGTPQKHFVTSGDTATTLKFRIVSGTGVMKNLRVSHTLTQLKGAWTSSNLNKDTVTITLDSNYVRSATDTIKTNLMLRTHTGTLTLTSVNVKAPRYRPLIAGAWRDNFHNAVSGTISGNYTAAITFQRGDAYKERSINRDFTVTIGGGEGSLNINGRKFKVNMRDGQPKP